MKPFRVHVSPIESYVDEALTIKLEDFEPNETISIHTKLWDQKGHFFTNTSTFKTDDEGRKLLSSAEIYELFWAAEKEKVRHGDYFYKSDAKELDIELVVKRQGSDDYSVRLKRYFYNESVTREEVNDQGIVGTLFSLHEGKDQPAVLLLGGSDGEIQEHASALLASKGYTVFSLAYFGQSGVSKDLHKIPLEYFHQAIQWLKREAEQEKVTVIGYSRGAELALLLASTYDEFSAVIAGAPGAYVTSGLRNTIYAPIPSWTLNEVELPYLPFKYRPAQMFSMFGGMLSRKPVSLLSIWENSLSSGDDTVESSRIQVENIKAPVMLIAGGHDQVWPAALFAERIKEKVNEHPVQALTYEKAGHFIAFPYALPGMPANVNVHVGGGMIMDFGGTKEDNAFAVVDSWGKVQSFLREYT